MNGFDFSFDHMTGENREYYELTTSQLPVGLIAELVEHNNGIAEVMGSNLVQA